MLSKDHAWWLPKGSIRALLAVIIILPTVAVLAMNAQYELLLSIAVIAVNFYFLKDAMTGETRSDEVGASNPIDPLPEEDNA